MSTWKIASKRFRCMKKTVNIKGKTRCIGHALVGAPKGTSLAVSLLLWCKIVAMHCFISLLGLQLWSVSEADEISSFDDFLKFYIRLPVLSVFFLFFLMLHLILVD